MKTKIKTLRKVVIENLTEVLPASGTNRGGRFTGFRVRYAPHYLVMLWTHMKATLYIRALIMVKLASDRSYRLQEPTYQRYGCPGIK